ncbi:hypothetical protein GCM10028812_52650 [Ancylobacter sonchi]
MRRQVAGHADHEVPGRRHDAGSQAAAVSGYRRSWSQATVCLSPGAPLQISKDVQSNCGRQIGAAGTICIDLLCQGSKMLALSVCNILEGIEELRFQRNAGLPFSDDN